MMAERTPDVGDASWPRGLAEATRLGSEESAAAQAALVRRKGQFARAVATRYRDQAGRKAVYDRNR